MPTSLKGTFARLKKAPEAPESGLQDPLLFYSDALVYTAYTRLRIPRGDGESPIQKWQRLCGHPTAMDLSHLRVFGSECTVHIPRHKRDKSGYTAVFGKFIGYSSFSRRYRVYIPSRNVVLERESVQWNENNPSSVREGDGTCDEPTTEIRVNTENPENPEIRKNPEIRENPEEDQNHTESEDEGGHCSLHDLGNASGNSHDRLMGRLQAKQLASLCLQNKTLYEAYVLAEDVPLPKNLKEALSTGNPYRKEWQAALNKEKASFVKNRVFGKFVRIEELKRQNNPM